MYLLFSAEKFPHYYYSIPSTVIRDSYCCLMSTPVQGQSKRSDDRQVSPPNVEASPTNVSVGREDVGAENDDKDTVNAMTQAMAAQGEGHGRKGH